MTTNIEPKIFPALHCYMGVIAVGPGRKSEDGNVIAMEVKVGDIVIYAMYGGTEIKVEDAELMILRESDILAKKKK